MWCYVSQNRFVTECMANYHIMSPNKLIDVLGITIEDNVVEYAFCQLYQREYKNRYEYPENLRLQPDSVRRFIPHKLQSFPLFCR